MPSRSEEVLVALFARLRASLPLDVELVRNDGLPTKIPPAGWVCLRDGDPGTPEVLLSPLQFVYEHAAEVDLVVDALPGVRETRFDTLKMALGLALMSDHTLGGVCDYAIGEAPQPVDLVVEGGHPLKAATVSILLTYATSNPLV